MRLPTRIFLIGFSASGKSTVGPLLAARLDYKPVDSDAEIERLQGVSCQSIIKRKGIDYFRQCEVSVLDKWCREDTGGIVAALGGGRRLRRMLPCDGTRRPERIPSNAPAGPTSSSA